MSVICNLLRQWTFIGYTHLFLTHHKNTVREWREKQGLPKVAKGGQSPPLKSSGRRTRPLHPRSGWVLIRNDINTIYIFSQFHWNVIITLCYSCRVIYSILIIESKFSTHNCRGDGGQGMGRVRRGDLATGTMGGRSGITGIQEG